MEKIDAHGFGIGLQQSWDIEIAVGAVNQKDSAWSGYPKIFLQSFDGDQVAIQLSLPSQIKFLCFKIAPAKNFGSFFIDWLFSLTSILKYHHFALVYMRPTFESNVLHFKYPNIFYFTVLLVLYFTPFLLKLIYPIYEIYLAVILPSGAFVAPMKTDNITVTKLEVIGFEPETNALIIIPHGKLLGNIPNYYMNYLVNHSFGFNAARGSDESKIWIRERLAVLGYRDNHLLVRLVQFNLERDSKHDQQTKNKQILYEKLLATH